MINAKKIYNTLLSDENITALVPEDNILNAYPADVNIFPCIIFLDAGQNDGEYFDDKPGASSCSVEIHIFTKKIDGYVSSADVAVAIAEVFNEHLWNGNFNREVSDPDPDTEHRVIIFNKSIFN